MKAAVDLYSRVVLLFSVKTQAQQISKWWKEGGSTQAVTALSLSGGGGSVRQGKPADLLEIRQACDTSIMEPQLFSSVCRLAVVQTRKQGETQPLYYDACQETKEGSSLTCNRRVDASGFCASCNRSGKTAKRFNLRCKYSDYADSLWMTTFHEGASKVVSMTPDDAHVIEVGEGGRDALEEVLRKQYFVKPVQVTVRAKPETYMGEQRTGIACVDVRPVDLRSHGRTMLKELLEWGGSL